MTDRPAGNVNPGWQGGAWQPPAQYAPAGPGWQAPPQTGRRSGRLAIGIAIGVLASVLVGAVLMFTNVLTVGSDGAAAGPDDTPIALPAELAGLRDAVTEIKNHPDSFGDSEKESQEFSRALTDGLAAATASYRDANPGAAVAVRGYADAGTELFAAVVAVRAPSPGLALLPSLSPGRPELAGLQRIEKFGAVQCYVVNVRATTNGGNRDPKDDQTTACHRSGDALTVIVQGSAVGPEQQSTMVRLTDAAFTTVSGTG